MARRDTVFGNPPVRDTTQPCPVTMPGETPRRDTVFGNSPSRVTCLDTMLVDTAAHRDTVTPS